VTDIEDQHANLMFHNLRLKIQPYVLASLRIDDNDFGQKKKKNFA